jgi:hypothetical protein
MTDLQCTKIASTRKPHFCEWCSETIQKGEPAQYRAYIFDGDFNSSWQHPECFEAMEKSDPFYLTEGWTPGDCGRGVTMI